MLARKHVTQVRVLLRVLDTVIVLVTLGFALMTFGEVRQYGVSLFASAGAAGVIFGLAAQPVLSNLIAGIQIAVTQPIRLEDAVTVQNEYGWIEEINATYVVIRLWDLRRLIVPLNYFIQQPFYNWTRQAATTIGSVMLYLDYTAPVEIIRKKANELVAQTKQDNAKVTSVQVTNASAQAIEVRILVNSDSAATTGNACADLREKLIAFLQQEYPQALPRQRNEIIEPPVRKGGAVDDSTVRASSLIRFQPHHGTGLKSPAACSMTAPSANSVASSNGRPINCSPSGRPCASDRSAPKCPAARPCSRSP